MISRVNFDPPPGPRLGLFRPEEIDEPTTTSAASTNVSSRCTLRQFFERWFQPIVLKADRDCTDATVGLYEDALGYWERITGDPPISQIDEYTVALFQNGLRIATYRRGLAGQEYPLGAQSQHKHLRNIRAVLHRTGPTIDPNRKGKGLIAEAPHIRLPAVPVKRKPCFSLKQAMALLSNAHLMTQPAQQKTGITPLNWWRGRLGLHFYTGLRSGTIRRLTWAVIEEDDEGNYWFNLPSHLVTKTQKETRIIVHPLLYGHLFACRRTSSPAEPLSPQPHCDRWIQSLHDRLQNLAGVPEAKWLSPHAWRRMHGDQLAQIGLRDVQELCRSALDHADVSTTTSHYVDVLNKFRLKLPPLW